MRKSLLIILLISGMLLLWCTPVFGHPHVFISPQVHFSFSGDTLSYFNVTWYFDDMSTMDIVGPHAINATLSLSSSEQKEILSLEGLPGPSRMGSFCYLEIDGSLVTLSSPKDISLSVNKGRLVYTFTYDVHRTVSRTAKLWFFDRSNFIAFDTKSGYYTISRPAGSQPMLSIRPENYVERILISI